MKGPNLTRREAEKDIKKMRMILKLKSPKSGVINCLKCEEPFLSEDIKKEHICPVCNRSNAHYNEDYAYCM